jgi:hypothetical protein
MAFDLNSSAALLLAGRIMPAVIVISSILVV